MNASPSLVTDKLLYKWRNLSILLIIVNLLFVLLILGIALIWHEQRQDHVVPPHSATHCYPANNGKISDVCKTQTVIDGIQFCCGNQTISDILDSRIEKVYSEQHGGGVATEHCASQTMRPIAQEVRPMARVVGLVDGNRSPLLHWNVSAGDSFVYNITYLFGRFVIRVVGYYYVYSQVTFIKEQNGENKPPLIHSLYRQNKFSKTRLLMSFLSACQLQTGSSNSTSYMGSVVYMNIGDELFVEVTDLTRLHDSPQSHFFGVRLI